MPPGTPVLAARDGVVIYCVSEWSTSYKNPRMSYAGNGVILRHEDSEETVYWHALWNSLRVKVGESVRRGHTLFLSGQTGYATYPHLHFGVYEGIGQNKILVGKSKAPDFLEPLPLKVSYKHYEQ